MAFSFLGVLLVLSQLGCGGGEKAVTLRLRLEKGKGYVFESSVNQTTQGVGGSKTEAEQKLVTTVKVDDASEGKYKTTSTISDVEIVSAALGAEQKAALKSQIEAVKLQIEYDELGHSLGSKTPDAGALAATMGAQGVGFMGLHYPSRPVKVGDKWSAEFDIQEVLGSMLAGLKAKGSTKIPIAYTLKTLESRGGKSVAVIAFDMGGEIAFTVDRPDGQAAEVKMKTDSKGEYVVDAATGLPLESTTTGRNDIDAMGQKISQEMKILVKYRG